jgi:hypothetical protein
LCIAVLLNQHSPHRHAAQCYQWPPLPPTNAALASAGPVAGIINEAHPHRCVKRPAHARMDLRNDIMFRRNRLITLDDSAFDSWTNSRRARVRCAVCTEMSGFLPGRIRSEFGALGIPNQVTPGHINCGWPSRPVWCLRPARVQRGPIGSLEGMKSRSTTNPAVRR